MDIKYSAWNILHIGQNGQLYYTDIHNHPHLTNEFCIDERQNITSNDSHGNYDYSDFNYYDYYTATDEDEPCQEGERKRPHVGILYCGEVLLNVRKCCSNDEEINIR